MPRGRSDFSAYPGRQPTADDLAAARSVLAKVGLAAYPITAVEIIEAAVETVQQRDEAWALLRQVGREAGDGAMADLLAVYKHRLASVEERVSTAETALTARLRGETATTEVTAWLQAKSTHTRSS